MNLLDRIFPAVQGALRGTINAAEFRRSALEAAAAGLIAFVTILANGAPDYASPTLAAFVTYVATEKLALIKRYFDSK